MSPLGRTRTLPRRRSRSARRLQQPAQAVLGYADQIHAKILSLGNHPLENYSDATVFIDELIAQAPLPQRSASRLLQVQRDALVDRVFSEIIELLQPGDVLVFNDTRVLNARFFGAKETGGKVEVLVERVLDTTTVLAQVRTTR